MAKANLTIVYFEQQMGAVLCVSAFFPCFELFASLWCKKWEKRGGEGGEGDGKATPKCWFKLKILVNTL